MSNPGDRAARYLEEYAGEVRRALGEDCVSVVLYGSAAGVDWVEGKSDLNTVIVVRRIGVRALDALAPVIARWRPRGLALPVLLDSGQVEQGTHLFPMELDDIQRQHRVLAGLDLFAAIQTEEAALRRECAQEAFGKVLRLRALYMEHAADAPALERMITESVKSFVIVLRHLLRLQGQPVPAEYDGAVLAGEAVIGPLPAMRRALAQRSADRPSGLVQVAREYVEEAERLVAAVTELCA
ncbi:MAG: hypothetical protein AB7V27_04280 [Candidatus Binatia bacterium]